MKKKERDAKERRREALREAEMKRRETDAKERRREKQKHTFEKQSQLLLLL